VTRPVEPPKKIEIKGGGEQSRVIEGNARNVHSEGGSQLTG
jgi:hypothetical protein